MPIRANLRCSQRRRGHGSPLALLLLAGVTVALTIGGAVTSAQGEWFRFNIAFIEARYATDSAIGELEALNWARASRVHSVSCGGNDGELHIGSFEHEIDVPQAQRPVSHPMELDEDWGIVYELPNARDGNGPALLTNSGPDSPATFRGYFRVWNEGHGSGAVFPSNPHHVLELHPACGFTVGNTVFDAPELVAPIAGYRAYGITRLRQFLEPLEDGDWPLVYRDGDDLVVSLQRSQNFFQFPAIVRSKTAVTGGHELILDIFSFPNYQNQIFTGIRAITVTGSPADDDLDVGTQTTLQGFFSINIRVALDHVGTADDEDEAVHVPEALEYFVFGRTAQKAVISCS